MWKRRIARCGWAWLALVLGLGFALWRVDRPQYVGSPNSFPRGWWGRHWGVYADSSNRLVLQFYPCTEQRPGRPFALWWDTRTWRGGVQRSRWYEWGTAWTAPDPDW